MRKEKMFKVFGCDFLRATDRLVYAGAEQSSAEPEGIPDLPVTPELPQSIDPKIQEQFAQAGASLVNIGKGLLKKVGTEVKAVGEKLNDAQWNMLRGFDQGGGLERTVNSPNSTPDALKIQGTVYLHNIGQLYNKIPAVQMATAGVKGKIEGAFAGKTLDRAKLVNLLTAYVMEVKQAVDAYHQETQGPAATGGQKEKAQEKAPITPKQMIDSTLRLLERGEMKKDVVMITRIEELVGQTIDNPDAFVNAVKQFQKELGVKADGIFGPDTYKALKPAQKEFVSKKLSDQKRQGVEAGQRITEAEAALQPPKAILYTKVGENYFAVLSQSADGSQVVMQNVKGDAPVSVPTTAIQGGVGDHQLAFTTAWKKAHAPKA